MKTVMELAEEVFNSEEKLYDFFKKSRILETLPANVHNEKRIAIVSALDILQHHLDKKETITTEDIKLIRLVCTQISDVIPFITDKGLKTYLKNVASKLETYLKGYYQKFKKLPSYAWYEKKYRSRRVELSYDRNPIYIYFKEAYLERPSSNIVKGPGGVIDLSDIMKDKVIHYLEHGRKRPSGMLSDEEVFDTVMYTYAKLKDDLEKMKKKHKQQLSEDKDPRLELIIEGLKRSKIGEE